MAIQLKFALKTAGCKMAPQPFRDLVKKVFLEKFRGCTDSDVYLDPDKARLLWQTVRSRASCAELPELLINRTLENLRKKGELPQTRRPHGQQAGGQPTVDQARPLKIRRGPAGPKAKAALRATA